MRFDRFEIERSMDTSGLKSTSRFVLIALLQFCDGEGTACPSIAQIASRAGLTTRAVSTHLRVLETRGWITPLLSPAPSGARVYRLTAPLAPRSPEARRV